MPSTLRTLSTVLAALVALACNQTVHASAVTSIDGFTIVRSGLAGTAPPQIHDGRTVFYRDGFGDGAEPPAGGTFFNGDAGTYSVLGSYPAGAEAAGRLALNSALGGPFVNAAGGGRTLQRSTLRTDVDAATPAGLKQAFHTFGVYGLFDLASPPLPGDGYGIALTDGSAVPATTSLDLLVRRENSGALVVRFQEQDFLGQVVDTLELDDLSAMPAGVDQIELRLLRASLTDNLVTAAYRFWDDGAPISGFNEMSRSVEFFRHNGFARANFFAVQAGVVPEPATLPLVALAAGLAGALRRRSRSAAAGSSPCGTPGSTAARGPRRF